MSPINLLKFEQLEIIDEQYLNKQKKLRSLLNTIKDFNEYEITRVIKIVEEIKLMHK